MRTVQTIPITLDKPRTLLLDLRAMARTEQALAQVWGQKRVSLIQVFQSQDLGITELTHLLWAGLLHEEPTLTYDGALGLMRTIDLQALATVVAQAMQEQLGMEVAPQGAPVGPQQPGTTPSGTGDASGPARGTTSA